MHLVFSVTCNMFMLHIAYVIAAQSDPEHKSSRELDRKATAPEHQPEVEMHCIWMNDVLVELWVTFALAAYGGGDLD